jgi:hypothetical protein
MSSVSDGLRLTNTQVIVTGKPNDPLFQIPDDLRNRENENVRDRHGVSATLDLTPVTGFVQSEVDVVKQHKSNPPASWPLAQIVPTFAETDYHNKGLKVEEDESLCSSGPSKKNCAADDPRTWHRVKGKVTIEEGADPIRNVVIWATGDIELGEGVRLTGAILVSGGKIDVGEDAALTDVTLLAVSSIGLDESVRVGALGGGAFDSYLFAGGNVTVGEEARFEAVFLGLGAAGAAGSNLKIEAEGRFDETTMVASGWIELREGIEMTGKPRTSAYPMINMNASAAAGEGFAYLVR